MCGGGVRMRCAVAIRERARRRAAEKRERQTDGDGAFGHETWQPIVLRARRRAVRTTGTWVSAGKPSATLEDT